MKALQVPFSYAPDPPAGTEEYVRMLVAGLAANGWSSVVAAPADEDAAYDVDGLPVRRFRTSERLKTEETYARHDDVAARSFARVLEDERPDVVHLHAFVTSVSVASVEEARRRSIPVVFTHHVPMATCARGTLLRWGREACDGSIPGNPCAACALQAHGIPRPAALALARFPSAPSRAAWSLGLGGDVFTALGMRHLCGLFEDSFRRFAAACDRLVVQCGWARDVLLRNGVPAAKLVLCRHGYDGPAPEPRARRAAGEPPRLFFAGRLAPEKGFRLLLQALRAAPRLELRLDAAMITQRGEESELRRGTAAAAADARVRLLPPLGREGVCRELAASDALLVPSQWLETGPLVVLESFAAGTPVIGSDLGGIAELVRDGVDGLLVQDFRSSDAWARVLRRFAEEPGLAAALRSGVRPPRRAAEVAAETAALYEGLLREAGR